MNLEQMESLASLANELSNAPQDQKMSTFLRIMQTASAQNIRFTEPEQDLLFSVLTEHMPPEEKKKAELIRKLSSQMRKSPR